MARARAARWAGALAASLAPLAALAARPSQARASCRDDEDTIFDVAVVGGGVVGLAVARECAARGERVALLEKEDALAAAASSGNSGLGCTGYDAPVGSLERKLLRRSIQLHQELYRSFGLSHGHVRKSGSLVVAWNDDQLAQLPAILQENRLAGDEEAVLLDRDQVLNLEPAISTDARAAVFCPYEAVVEPWLVPMGYGESARRFGARIFLRARVTEASRDPHDPALWTLRIAPSQDASSGRSRPGALFTEAHARAATPQHLAGDEQWTAPTLRARVVVNCAGLWGDDLERSAGRPQHAIDFSIAPRKGQFVVFEPLSGASPDAILEPVPSQFTKGVIAWTTVYGNVVVGPTAVPQSSKTDRATDPDTVERLRAWGQKAIPALRDAQVMGTYAGLRPATEHRDYQISVPQPHWVTVAGIRSTGLTASSGIGEYVADIVESILNPLAEPRSPASSGKPMVGVSQAAATPTPARDQRLETVPPLQDLAREFRARGDGCVTLYGRLHRVTHPISSFGMESIDISGDVYENTGPAAATTR